MERESRIKLLILVLLSLLLCLGALLSSAMYRRDPDGDAEADTGTQTQTDSTAVMLYSENGLWGAKTAGGKVMIEPAWYYLRKMSGNVLIARDGSGANDRYGLLGIDGNLLAPLIYTSFQQIADGIWAAELTETGRTGEQYHLYRDDGTRWQDAVWDTCTYEDGMLTLTNKQNRFTYAVSEPDWQLQAWYSEHAVGLHTVRMEWDAAQLAELPMRDAQVLLALGEASADYLTYLFLTGEAPDASLLSAEDTASLRVGYRYRSCTLASAEISRIALIRAEGYPAYSVRMNVTYRRDHSDADPELVNTVMFLTVSRNAAGEYTYSGFTDAQALAAPSSFLN